ncbi:MAG: translation initiation factor [Opitutales bacterium]|nr:translation initiation factor [Opitutales bacterium]NRA26260.1 translation initiation factor [Opitutales bacterium]
MGKKKNRISTAGSGAELGQNPFGSLSSVGLPKGDMSPIIENAVPKKAKGPRHQVQMRRLTAGKGGKTVTELTGFEPDFFANRAKDALRSMKNFTGAGGAVKGKAIEVQGDVRDRLQPWLEDKGYRVVRAGG